MNILFLILFFVLVILLIIVMFLLLKRLIFKVNQQSMDYFLDKLKAYDQLVDDREKKLKELDELIDNKENELNKKEESHVHENTPVFFYDLKNVNYKDENIFHKMKEVDRKFHFDNKKVVSDFIDHHFDASIIEEYKKYCEIKERFNQDTIFNILTKKESKQIDEVRSILGDSVSILDHYLKKNKVFHIKKFVSYLNNILNTLDPYVYVYVGNENENYNSLHSYVQTKFDDSIYKGIRIIYRGKLYDYSI